MIRQLCIFYFATRMDVPMQFISNNWTKLPPLVQIWRRFPMKKRGGVKGNSDDKVAFAVHCFRVLKGYRQSRCWAEIDVVKSP